MTRVYLVRHGTHDLLGKVLAGRMPGVSLSEGGGAEAARLAAWFGGNAITRVLSSPLDRCRETAAPIAERLRLGVTVAPALNEIDCGEWTGRDFPTLASDPRWRAWNDEREQNAIPGGESIGAVQKRVMALLDEFARADDGPAVLVSHGDVIKAAVLTLLGAPLGWHDRLAIDPASITTLDLWPGGGKLVRLNEAA